MQGHAIHATADVHPDAIRSVERVYQLWDAALGARDIEAAVALYAEDTRLESPLVRHLLGSERGIVEGRDRLRDFVRIVFERTPPGRRHHRHCVYWGWFGVKVLEADRYHR